MTAASAPARTSVVSRPAASGPAAPTSLATVDFTNLFISDFGTDRKTGEQTPALAFFKSPGGLVYPSPQLDQEIQELAAQIREKHADAQSFRIRHAGLAYRAEVLRPLDQRRWWSLRPFPKHVPDFEILGFPDKVVERMARLGAYTGLVLFIGGTGDGKTTSASALVQHILCEFGGVCLTVEDPPEMPLNGIYGDNRQGRCFQEHWPERQFSEGIVSALRKNPDIIYIGEIRTPEAAIAAVNAALSGHLVISTIHGGTLINGVMRLHRLIATDSGPEYAALQLAESVLCLVNQRLQRKPRKIQRAQWLFLTPEEPDAIRAKIRDQKIPQLTNDIDQQARALAGAGSTAQA